LLGTYKILYPANAKIGEAPLMLVQGSIRNDTKTNLNHVVYTCAGENNDKKRLFTIFRSSEVEETLDFCRRCDECRVLFRLLGEFIPFL
jgi:hypothetical protein